MDGDAIICFSSLAGLLMALRSMVEEGLQSLRSLSSPVSVARIPFPPFVFVLAILILARREAGNCVRFTRMTRQILDYSIRHNKWWLFAMVRRRAAALTGAAWRGRINLYEEHFHNMPVLP